MCSGLRPLRPADIAARPYQSECAAGGRYGALETALEQFARQTFGQYRLGVFDPVAVEERRAIRNQSVRQAPTVGRIVFTHCINVLTPDLEHRGWPRSGLRPG